MLFGTIFLYIFIFSFFTLLFYLIKWIKNQKDKM